MSPLPSAPRGWTLVPEIMPSTSRPPPLNPTTWLTSKVPMNYLPTPSQWPDTSNHPRVHLLSPPSLCPWTGTRNRWELRLLRLPLKRSTKQWEEALLRERELRVDRIDETVVIELGFFRQFVIDILITLLWVYLNFYSLLRWAEELELCIKTMQLVSLDISSGNFLYRFRDCKSFLITFSYNDQYGWN